METISTFEGFIWAIAGLTLDVKAVCIKLSYIFIIPTAFYGVLKFYFGFEEDGRLNLRKYVGVPLMLLMLLMNYSIMIDITGRIGGIVIRSLPGNELGPGDMAQAMWDATNHRIVEETRRNYMNLQSEDASWWDKVKDTAEGYMNLVTAIPRYVTRTVFSGLQGSWVQGCRMIITKSRDVILGFMIIVGPISILLSMTPVFRDVFKKWFRIYVGILLWMVTINIIDAMIIKYHEEATKFGLVYKYQDPDGDIRYGDGSEWNPSKLDDETVVGISFINGLDQYGMENAFINFVFAMMYMMVPLLTSFFCGEKLAGGFLSMMIDRSVGTAMKAGQIAAGAASGGASMIGSAAAGASTSGLSK